MTPGDNITYPRGTILRAEFLQRKVGAHIQGRRHYGGLFLIKKDRRDITVRRRVGRLFLHLLPRGQAKTSLGIRTRGS